MDRRLKGVVGRGSAAEVGRGCGWVVAEVDPVMIFFDRRGFVFVCVCVCVCVCGLWFVDCARG